MRASTLLVSVLGGAAVFAAPVFPDLNAAEAEPKSIDGMTEYFTLLARKVQESKALGAAPVCDLSRATLPEGGQYFRQPLPRVP